MTTTSSNPPGRTCRRAAWAGALLALLAGCAPMDARRDTEYLSNSHVADRPATRPTRSVSSFSESLTCMDRMLRAAQLPTTLVTSKQFPDYSGRVPVATKDMVITALSQMSRTSNAFRFVDYEVELARQDTVQNLTTILLNNNQLQLQRPALYFSGAISYFDQNVLNNRFDVGTSASRLETGYSRTRNAALMGLEMHLGDFRTRTLIPGLDSANEVILSNSGEGLDLSGRISNYGVQFSVGRDNTQGAGAGMRTLVELATIELVGKWARVPYWQCLTLEQAHPEFQRQLRDWWDDGKAGARLGLVHQSLVSQSYIAPSAQTPAANDPALRAAMARFQADHGLVASGMLDFPTYEAALRQFVGLNEHGQLARIGWQPKSKEPTGDANATAVIATRAEVAGQAAYGDPPAPRSIDMQVENVMSGRTAFLVGEQIFLSATLSRASHLYCYMADARGVAMRLLPNATHANSLVPGGLAVRIPDWMSPHPGFVLDAAAPGDQAVACFATDQDVSPALPEALRGPAITPLPGGLTTLQAIDQAFAAAAPNGYTRSALAWQVAPGQPAPAAPPPPPPAAPRGRAGQR